MKLDANLSPQVVREELGRRLAARRVEVGLSQAAVAREAGLGKRTVERLESGADGQISSLLRVLRVLGLQENLDALLPEPGIRPMDLLELKGQQRKRAPRTKPKTDSRPWRWGDEE